MRFLGLEVRRAAPPPPPPEPTRFLGDLTRLALQPGDVCVLMAPGIVSAETVVKMREAWAAAVGESVTLLVLDGGLRLAVLSPTAAAVAAAQIADGRAVQAAFGE